MRRFRSHHLPAIAALLLPPLMASCTSLRNDPADDQDGGPPRLSDRISNIDRNKAFDKKSLDIHKAYSSEQKRTYERSGLQNSRFADHKPVEANRFNTERFNTERFQAEGANEQRQRKWFQFKGDRNREQKTSSFANRRSQEDAAVYTTRRYPDESAIESIIGSRGERDITDRVMSTEVQGSGGAAAAAPTVIREATMSEGDIRALLNDQ